MRSAPLPSSLSSLRVLVPAVLFLLLAPSLAAQTEQPYRIGAYYHGVWSPESCNVCFPPNDDWWKGVREYAAGQIDPSYPWWQESFVHLTPALGYYDGSEPALLAKQIRQARANGLSFFAFNWYWDHSLHQGQGGEQFVASVKAFLEAPNTADLEFAITVTAHPWDALQIPNDHIPRAVNRILAYMAEPHYLRTDDGRPILFFTDTRGIREGFQRDINDFNAYLEGRAIESLGVSPFFVFATEREAPTDGYAPDGPYLKLRQTPSLDGASCYNEFFKSLINRRTDLSGSLTHYNQEMSAHFDRWADWVPAVIPCYMADFSEKPRTEVGLPAHLVRYINDFSLGTYRAGLQEIKQFSDSYDGKSVDDMVVLYAWNEWREAGHSLEPSMVEGNTMLHEVSTVFGLQTFGSNECRVRGDCPESVEFPTGSLDRADCDLIAGWVRDPDTTIPTLIEVVPEGSDVPAAVAHANLLRRDLPFRSKKHGFSIPTPEALKTGGAQTFEVRAVNIGMNGNDTGSRQVLASGRSVTCAGVERSDSTPTGSFDVANCNKIAGWARDDESTEPLRIEIFRDGPRGGGGTLVQAATADRTRNDLPFADKDHGFRIDTPDVLKDGTLQTLYLYARDIEPNGQPTPFRQLLANSPKQIQCAGAASPSTAPGDSSQGDSSPGDSSNGDSSDESSQEPFEEPSEGSGAGPSGPSTGSDGNGPLEMPGGF